MTPREALEQSGQIPVNGCGYGAKSQIDAILTALAPFLIPEGCVAVCRLCRLSARLSASCEGYQCTPISAVEPCPLRKAMP